MPLALFIHQPFCNERSMCEACRGEDPVYRIAWAGRYQMPVGWPNCPYNIPFGFKGTPRPPEPHMLGILVDMPDSPEAKALEKTLYDRAEVVRPICQGCNQFIEIAEDGLQVQCKVGYSCGCAQEKAYRSRGYVHLGVGFCPENKWGGK